MSARRPTRACEPGKPRIFADFVSDVDLARSLRPPVRLDAPVTSKAAVALTLRESAHGLELLFIHRAEHPQDPWSGQMAFPGGRCERGDEDLERTAIRETAEEIGLDLRRSGHALGSLDETRAMSRMRALDLSITPFVFRLREHQPHGVKHTLTRWPSCPGTMARTRLACCEDEIGGDYVFPAACQTLDGALPFVNG